MAQKIDFSGLPDNQQIDFSGLPDNNTVDMGGLPDQLNQIKTELNQIKAQVPQSQPGMLERSWNAINTPLIDIRSGSTKTATDAFAAEHPYIGKPMNYVLDALSSLTNPLSVGLGLTSAGSSVAGQLGAKGLATALEVPGLAASGGMVGHGGYNLLRPSATLPERAGGLLEAGLGGLGLRNTRISLERPGVEVPKIDLEQQSKLNLEPETPLDRSLQRIHDQIPVDEATGMKIYSPEGVRSLEVPGSETPAVKSTPASAAQNLFNALDNVEPLQTSQEALGSAEKSKRLAAAAQVSERGLEGFRKEKSLLAGKLPKVEFEPLKLSSDDVDSLMTIIREHPSNYGFDKISAREGLEKLVNGVIPQRSEVKLLGNIFGDDFAAKVNNIKPGGGKLQQWYDLPRGLMSVDPPFITSAAFRQGSSLAFTRDWFKGWVNAAKAYSSKTISQTIDENIHNLPLFKPTTLPDGTIGPSYAEQVGLRLGDLTKYSKRDEAIRGELAEKIPLYGRHVAGNNRAFNSFMNTVSSGKFTNLIDAAEKMGLDPKNNIPLGREIAEFVNTALKRGKLGVEIGNYEVNLERHARTLSNIFFSPRTLSSQVRMMNPSTYVTASPMVRRQYIYALGRTLGVWGSIASLLDFASNKVSVERDPTSADFGKIRIGNTRIDLPGGMQQFLVLGARLAPQIIGGGRTTSTTTGKSTPLGQGYKPETRTSLVGQFLTNRLHPTAKTLYDLGNAQESAPFHVGDKAIQLAAPMFADDVMSVMQEDPELALPILGLSGAGVGTQSYERGSFGKPVFLPEEYDINIGAKEQR